MTRQGMKIGQNILFFDEKKNQQSINISMCIRNVLVISILVCCTICIEGQAIDLKFCKFECSDICVPPADKSSPLGIAKSPNAYYWRDFYGVVPIDAYPLGPITQFPQTYIGMVYDPTKNGTFITTIYNGLDYVYTTLNNKTSKVDKHIQILCTERPEKLTWLKLTSGNAKAIVQTYKPILAGKHIEVVNGSIKYIRHFIVKTDKCSFPYAGHVSGLNDQLQYALIDGSSDTTDKYLWLTYKEEEPEASPSTPSEDSSKLQYQAEIKADTKGAEASTKITMGSCTATCSIDSKSSLDASGIPKMDNLVKVFTSMAYYWQPNPVIQKDKALVAGSFYSGTQYIGQSFLAENALDVGTSDLRAATINEGYANIDEQAYYHVLSTNFPDSFKWMNTSSQDFSKQDKNRMIPGGARDNGTETFVCREVYKDLRMPGSAREGVINGGTYCYAYFGPAEKFQVLMLDPKIPIPGIPSIPKIPVDPKIPALPQIPIDSNVSINAKASVQTQGGIDAKVENPNTGKEAPKQGEIDAKVEKPNTGKEAPKQGDIDTKVEKPNTKKEAPKQAEKVEKPNAKKAQKQGGIDSKDKKPNPGKRAV